MLDPPQQSYIKGVLAESHLVPSFIQDLCSEGGSPVLQLLRKALAHLEKNQFEHAGHLVDNIVDIAWEQLHTGHWKSVAVVWRDLYSYGCLLQAIRAVIHNKLSEAMKCLDLALIMGGPMLEDVIKDFISNISLWNVINIESSAQNSPSNISDKRPRESVEDSPSKVPKIETPAISQEHEVERTRAPSMETFYRDYMKPCKPVIITSAMDYWPALNARKWDTNYLKKVAGLRTVPVEVGKTYLEDEWGQKLMTLSEFIDNFVNNPASTQTGYLAQTPLFDQIPELRKDIETPEYCAMDADNDIFIMNAWFGPKGTITPAHYDPHHNLLSQVVGCKYVKLFPEEASKALYPHTEQMLYNTSQVDVENPDLEKYPDYNAAPFLECILAPGEMLYIPPKYWHFVKSLSTSFSVSFWWS